jgi:hypothetical protein
MLGSYAQKIARITVDLPVAMNGLNVPVSIDLDAITFAHDSTLTLVEERNDAIIFVPFQVQQGSHRTLEWMVTNEKTPLQKRTYQLTTGHAAKFAQVTATTDSGALTIRSGKQSLLRYYFKTVYPPVGIDTNYKRSGFIHPLWTPHGQALTQIQPADHYHHYGIWNPWTHVLFEKDTVDFWNLKDRKGTVRFAGFAATTGGAVFAQFETLHEHVAFKKDGKEKVALRELQTIKVYRPVDGDNDYYIADITSQMNCASESPVLLLTYRYGGLGWRATALWNKDNSEVLTSEGKNRAAADGSTARWCVVQGTLMDDYGGAVMLSYPANYNHPEPLRIWPENSNNRGDMFANFDPTKDKDWLLQPGKTYVLKYRLLVFNGKFDKAKAESAWQYFAHPPAVVVEKVSGE